MPNLFAALLLSMALAAPALTAAAAEKIVTLSGASALLLDVPGRVTVRIDPRGEARARVRMEPDFLDRITVRVERGIARIATSGSFRSERLHIDVVLNALESMDVRGATEVELERVEARALALQASGSAQVGIGAGRVRRLSLRLAGSAELFAPNLAASECTVYCRDSANAKLACSESVSGQVSGAGGLAVSGNPKRRAVRAEDAAEVRFE